MEILVMLCKAKGHKKHKVYIKIKYYKDGILKLTHTWYNIELCLYNQLFQLIYILKKKKQSRINVMEISW